MDTAIGASAPLHAMLVAIVALTVLLVGGLIAAGDDTSGACQTTVYEGCPERWEYLWAESDDS